MGDDLRMIDLTPLDVRKKRGDFAKTLRGYDASEVDNFLELVAERMEALVKEKLELEEEKGKKKKEGIDGREGGSKARGRRKKELRRREERREKKE